MSDPPLLKSRERLISYRYLNRAVKGATQARREGVRRVRASPPPPGRQVPFIGDWRFKRRQVITIASCSTCVLIPFMGKFEMKVN